MRMLRAAAYLAAMVAAVQLALFALAERQLQMMPVVDGQATSVPALRWVWAIGWALPWLAGALLVALRFLWRGVAVLVTSALLLLSTGLGAVGSAVGESIGAGWSDVVERFGGLTLWLLAAAVGVTAWLGRPRGSWRGGAGPAGWYVALAVFGWLPTVLRTTAYAPPGAPRRFVETDVSLLSGMDVVAYVLGAVVVAVLLVAAPRLRRDVGGPVLLAFAVPSFLAGLGWVFLVVTEDGVIFTPAGVLGLVGLAGLVVVGVAWSVADMDGADRATT